ncbi:hypothetical protein [Streptomyces sp. NRRL S-813]|uniref:hypothetical protein n=1 Tax=Streptomyces sp. NRRL S-813 TaxID=1463919 RepID=UPI0004BF4878|nr:hypothetical protein [Streptomyces sp. NRRL S-813]
MGLTALAVLGLQTPAHAAPAPAPGALTVATPEDPAVGDGLYTLFSAVPGVHTLSVTADGHRTLTRQVVVHEDRVARKNVGLQATRPTET